MSHSQRLVPVENWGRSDASHHKDVCGVTIDVDDNVYLLTRGVSQVCVYDKRGVLLRRWGQEVFSDRPHGLKVSKENIVYCVDEGDHTVRSFTIEGEARSVIGNAGVRSNTGYDPTLGNAKARSESIRRSAPPFNHPTGVAVGPNGDVYVSDGYGNARIHRFSRDGVLLGSWGEPGISPGQFIIPHGILVTDDERVLVADRENSRIQVFTLVGEFIQQWNNVQRPTAIAQDRAGNFWVAEALVAAGSYSWIDGPARQSLPARVSVLDARGEVLSRFGEDLSPCEPGGFIAPHGIAVDSTGSIYVAEVSHTVLTHYANNGWAIADPDHCHPIQKFDRI